MLEVATRWRLFKLQKLREMNACQKGISYFVFQNFDSAYCMRNVAHNRKMERLKVQVIRRTSFLDQLCSREDKGESSSLLFSIFMQIELIVTFVLFYPNLRVQYTSLTLDPKLGANRESRKSGKAGAYLAFFPRYLQFSKSPLPPRHP